MAFERYHCVAGLALTFLSAPLQSADGTQAGHLLIHGVHTSTPAVADLLMEGRERSPTFRMLLREVEVSNFIVFVQTGSCRAPAVLGCLLHRVGSFHGQHYLRIVIAETRQSEDDAIATLGHELQHAVEVVREPGLAQSGDIRQLYRRIGYVTVRIAGGAIYETTRAVKTGTQIRRELQSERRVRERSQTASR